MSNMPELKPCPFCGNAPHYREHMDEDLCTHNQVVWKSVSCLEGCSAVSIPDGYDGGTAIERWNTRHIAPLTPAEALARCPEVAALVDAMNDLLFEDSDKSEHERLKTRLLARVALAAFTTS